MSVEFEENNLSPRNYTEEQTPKIASWLISHKIAKDVAQANKIQIIVSLVFIVLAIYIAFR